MLVGRFVLGLLVVAAAALTPARAESFEGRVISILRGDTLEVMRGKQPVQVTLHGVDAPEIDQPFGKEAVEFLASISFNKPVKVEVRSRDARRRLVSVVYLSKSSTLNDQVLAEGMAWWDTTSAPAQTRYKGLEAEARQSGKGLWSEPQPISPWAWRDGKRPAKASDPESSTP